MGGFFFFFFFSDARVVRNRNDKRGGRGLLVLDPITARGKRTDLFFQDDDL